MNREEAACIIEIGREAIEKLVSISGEQGEILERWVENWEFIEAFANGKKISCDGIKCYNPIFHHRPHHYEILETRINWKKVVENDGLHIRLNLSISGVYRLVGVSKRGLPLVQSEDGGRFFEEPGTVFFHDEVVPKPEWYELAVGE